MKKPDYISDSLLKISFQKITKEEFKKTYGWTKDYQVYYRRKSPSFSFEGDLYLFTLKSDHTLMKITPTIVNKSKELVLIQFNYEGLGFIDKEQYIEDFGDNNPYFIDLDITNDWGDVLTFYVDYSEFFKHVDYKLPIEKMRMDNDFYYLELSLGEEGETILNLYDSNYQVID